MSKKIAVLHHSQSGQLTEIVQNFCAAFDAYTVDWIPIELEKPFPFPWTVHTFFDAMPETVLEKPGAIRPLAFNHEQYNLVIFAYQPWFLSPSPLAMAVLQDARFRQLVQNTPVITLIGSRNMWINAQEVVKRELAAAGAKLMGNVPYVDRGNNLVSAFTILHWMLTGKKTKKWGIFPIPGVSAKDIEQAKNHGQLCVESLEKNQLASFQEELIASKWIQLPVTILFIEKRAKRLFQIWANLITNKEKKGGNRRFWVNLYKYYLIIALFLISPIVLTIYFIFVFPFSMKKIEQERYYYSNILERKHG
jgi:hypothetical protein